MVTFSMIRADTGGFVRHSVVHSRMLQVAKRLTERWDSIAVPTPA